MSKERILLVEDDPNLGDILKEYLGVKGYEVTLCRDGEEGWTTYKKDYFQLCILDVMMPKKDGFTLAKEIRKQDLKVPIIFLTAKSQSSDVVEGFHLGGNDYLKKPFSMEELIVRIENLLRNVYEPAEAVLEIGSFQFDYKKQELQFETEKGISLTHREAELLYHLYQHRNQVLDRSIILKKLWGDDDFFNARSMDVFITKLRKKLKKDSEIQIINVRGFGYKLIC